MIYNNSDAFNNVNTKFYSYNTGTEVDGTSFAQEWVNKVAGTTKAVFGGRTNYYGINKGRNKEWFKKGSVEKVLWERI